MRSALLACRSKFTFRSPIVPLSSMAPSVQSTRLWRQNRPTTSVINLGVGSADAAVDNVGSDVAAVSILGSADAAAGSVGSAVAAVGIVGSADAVAGSVGSAVVTVGIVGSADAVAGSVGSAVAAVGIVGSADAVAGSVQMSLAWASLVGATVVVRLLVPRFFASGFLSLRFFLALGFSFFECFHFHRSFPYVSNSGYRSCCSSKYTMRCTPSVESKSSTKPGYHFCILGQYTSIVDPITGSTHTSGITTSGGGGVLAGSTT